LRVGTVLTTESAGAPHKEIPAPTVPNGLEIHIMSSTNEIHKPGEPTPQSGLYDIVGPRGGKTGESVVSEKGKPFPPTDEPGQGFKIDKPSGK